jgi:hypothetical protein
MVYFDVAGPCPELAKHAGCQTLQPKDIKFLPDVQYDTRSTVIQQLQSKKVREKPKENDK